MGRQCLREIVAHKPTRLIRVFMCDSKGDVTDDRMQLVHRINDLGVPIEMLTKKELSALVGSESHQSFAAIVRPREHTDLKAFLQDTLDRESSMVVMLDSIYDPQNLGTLLRAAECFGADAVLWSKNRGSTITPVVTKASVGATELVPVITISNLVETIKKFKTAGYWIIGADVAEGVEDLNHFEFPGRCAIVMGSEGQGLRALVRQNLDHRIRIPLFGRIDSLNVSQATTIMLYRYRMAHPIDCHGG